MNDNGMEIYQRTFIFLGDSAKTLFESLKKKYNKRKNALKKARNKSGSESQAAMKAERALNVYMFLSWIDNFTYVRKSRTNVRTVNHADTVREEGEDFDSEEESTDESEEESGSEDVNESSETVDMNISKANSSLVVNNNAAISSSTPLPLTTPPLPSKANRGQTKRNTHSLNAAESGIPKKLTKMGKGTKSAYMDEMELNIIRDLGKSIKNDSRSLAADLRKLSELEYLIVKHEIRGVLFNHQMARFRQTSNQNQWQGGQWQGQGQWGPWQGPGSTNMGQFQSQGQMQTAQKQGQAVQWQRQVQPNGSQSQGQSQTQGDTMQYLDNVTKERPE